MFATTPTAQRNGEDFYYYPNNNNNNNSNREEIFYPASRCVKITNDHYNELSKKYTSEELSKLIQSKEFYEYLKRKHGDYNNNNNFNTSQFLNQMFMSNNNNIVNDNRSIVENNNSVTLNYKPTTLYSRLFANLLDTIIIVLTFLLFPIIGIWFLIFINLFLSFKSTTIAGYLLGHLVVKRETGKPIGFFKMIIRSLIGMFTWWIDCFLIVGCCGFLTHIGKEYIFVEIF